MTQIDGGAVAPVCSIRYFPETAIYPSRDQAVDFRRQLGAKYQSMGRSAQSAVDADGAAIWIVEYLRYRTSGCDHAAAVQNVMTQVDGKPAPETCLVECAYRVTTPVTSVPSNGGTFSAEVVRTSGACSYLALSETPWITLSQPIAGTSRGNQGYTVAANTGGARTGWVRFNYPGGVTYLEVNQGSLPPISFQLFDPATSTSPTTECQVRATSTTCTLTASTQPQLPTTVATYDWRVEYPYGGTKIRTQVSSSPTFSFTESCGVSASGGSVIPITVRLIASDAAGNTATVYSGQGNQPALQLRTFNCP